LQDGNQPSGPEFRPRIQEQGMKTVGQKVESFNVVGVKPGFNRHEENGVSAFAPIDEESFPGKWKVIYFYPKDFTFVCPTEIVGFARLAKDFEERDAVVLGGSTDNEFSKLGWRRDHAELKSLNQWQFADVTGSLVDQLGVRDPNEGVALRATFIVDPDNVIQHVSVNNLNVGRSPEEVLRILDGLQTDELCPCNRAVGGSTL
jgi:lipoyl-dependent peroxiredoxin subunit C